jgi:CRISPR-associated protein Csm3
VSIAATGDDEMKWEKIVRLKFELELKEGTRIGGSGGGLEIGELVDSNLAAIRNPLTDEFYIPGSSLKGKLRSVLEREKGRTSNDGREPCDCGRADCEVCTVFGAHKNTKPECGVTRIVVRDCLMSNKSREALKEAGAAGKQTVEYKTENVINRNSGAAEHPRTGERLLPGMTFDGEILLHIYEKDDAKKMTAFVRHGLGIIQEASSLGAGGSRGSGKVKFDNVREETVPLANLTV